MTLSEIHGDVKVVMLQVNDNTEVYTCSVATHGGPLQDAADLPAGRAAGQPAGAEGGPAVWPAGAEVHNDWSQEEEVLTPAHSSGWMETLFLFVQS